MKSLLKILAAAALAISLSTGLAAAATDTIKTTGPNSSNIINHNGDVDINLDASNDTDVDGNIDQNADSGNAKVYGNTNAGDATSGDATNESEASVDVTNDNSGLACSCLLGGLGSGSSSAEINTTGSHSTNQVNYNNDMNVDINLSNHTDVNIDVDQHADSGNAEVSNNTNGGSATSGNASNSSSLSIPVSNKN